MSSRSVILDAIRRNQPVKEPGQSAMLPALETFERIDPSMLVAEFRRRLEQMGGKLLEAGADGDLRAAVRSRIAAAGAVCSAVPELPGDHRLASDTAPASLEDVDLAVVRASFGVAETGSVALSERDLVVNALGYLAQHVLVLLDPADLVANLHHAYRRPEFFEGHYLVFQTGPSATADIEGVLIHGAQGVRSLSVALLPRSRPE